MRVKDIETERYQDYKFPSLFIASSFCDFKCCSEANIDFSICQNEPLAQAPVKEIPDYTIYRQFVNNPITKAVVIGGLEPLIQINEVINLIDLFRSNGENCPFVIYTGYYPSEIPEPLSRLKNYVNIIMKFGRFIPGHKPHYDNVLGIELASDNQYGEQIS